MIPLVYQPYIVLVVILILFYLIFKEKIQPTVGFVSVVLFFLLSGILSTKEVLSGFSNESIAVIVLLILITAGLRKNFDIEKLFEKAFSQYKTYRSFLLGMMTKVALLSSIINNTPVVAVMTPYIFNWGKKKGISPSKLLIPLSFATIMGGMITIIGTSTTLVLNGFLLDFKASTLHLPDFIITGLAVSTTGILFFATIGHRLLPNRLDLIESFKKNKREYLIQLELIKDSPLIGKTVYEAGLRNLKDVFLVEIIRENRVITPVEPKEVIHPNDILNFAGNTNKIWELIKSNRGLTLPQHEDIEPANGTNLVEAVISHNSSLVLRKVKETDFRNKYDAAIVAVHRNGEKLRGKIGEIKLIAGDLLLLFAGEKFIYKSDIHRDLYVISNIVENPKPEKYQMNTFIVVALVAITLLLLGYFSLFTSLLIIFSIMIIFKLTTVNDIKKEIDLSMIVILVFSLAIGQAIIKTQAGNILANFVMDLLLPYGNFAILTGLVLFTTILTSVINNVGAISISFPVAYSLSNTLGLNGDPFYVAIAFAASASFLTPIGYQTNLIIYGPGGYTFKDFFKVGVPVTLIYLITAITTISILYKSVFFPG